MEARWNGTVIARSDDIERLEGNAYFPFDSVDPSLVRRSDHTSVCGWKGTASYWDVVVDGQVNANAMWSYEDPRPAAAAIRGRVAFWKGVQVS
jgi:uncharacterized protein (DUF427 family)